MSNPTEHSHETNIKMLALKLALAGVLADARCVLSAKQVAEVLAGITGDVIAGAAGSSSIELGYLQAWAADQMREQSVRAADMFRQAGLT